MTTLALLLALAYVGVLLLMSRRAARGLPREARLPMQWGFDGRPTWRAPRDVALTLTPVLATLTLIPTALASLLGPLEGSDARLYFGVLIVMGLAWVGVHALHLWLVGRGRRAEGV
ncbi:hypothetical protein [Brevundimonas guildfordensis]|uniref:DUF1648 domain-containing protein n=1 Tax=Brevundimonas guildfordensis TaxID=2762241 RepID=A0ABR8R161_9CAUL|nr:hypothetical protein [Brevundimonas guildfordensis]MBD7941525.1 hypothetical protein [Brevundimonas guildfordensis]